ncbi:hypothetical protein [Kitasatospora sp. P5_F3]
MAGVTSRGRRSVAVVAFDGVQLLDVTGPVEVFTTANRYGADYRVRVVSPAGTAVATSAGLVIGTDGTADTLPHRIDTPWCPAGGTGALRWPTRNSSG